jgi:predicted nucleic acid-binding protein
VSFFYTLPPIVVDASATIEMLANNDKWIATFKDWSANDRVLLAPAGFLPEFANGLMLGRGRLAAGSAAARIDLALASGIEIADRGLAGLHEAMRLAQAHGMTVYDALYLQLALEVDAELATEDRQLMRAAIAEGVTLISET